MSNYQNENDTEQQVKSALGLLGGLVLIFVTLWYTLHTQISNAVLHMAWTSAMALDGLNGLLSYIGVPKEYMYYLVPAGIIDDLNGVKYWILQIDPRLMSTTEVYRMIELTGYCLRWLTPLVFFTGVFFIRKSSYALNLNRKFDALKLAELRKHIYPTIIPPINAKLHKVDSNEGLWRKEASPIRFAIINELIEVHDIDTRKNLLPKTFVATFDEKKGEQDGFIYVEDNMIEGISQIHNRCILNTGKTRRIFTEQMGPRFTSIDEWPNYKKALISVFMCFIENDKDTGIKLLDQFNRSFVCPSKKKKFNIDMTGVAECIAKYSDSKYFKPILTAHAYDCTLLAQSLLAARLKGRLAPQRFMWLKTVDRTLWYALHQEGGQTGWTEAAGPRAHLLAERSLGRPITWPYIEKAVEAYYKHLDSGEGWLPCPDTLMAFKANKGRVS